MSQTKKLDTPEITVSLVAKLISEQFPQWAQPITQVIPGGHDNRTFRLGQEMSVRLPSAERYAAKVLIEQQWLPVLASQLSTQIPRPLALGKPTSYYPWHWSIYAWIAGENANAVLFSEQELELLAIQVAYFLKELHKIDTTGAPAAGPHNFYRGGDLSVYNHETHKALKELHNTVDIQAARTVWTKALSSQWHKKPVWIHGDLSTGNILIKDKELAAVIDFGGTSIGDPSCDLAIAWLLFKDQSRKVFKQQVHLDANTWDRARGWALWKALITLAALKEKNSTEASTQKNIIHDIIKDSNF